MKTQLIKTLAIYYLIFCGLSVNLLAACVYLYDKSIIYTVFEKIENKIKLRLNPNAQVDAEKELVKQLAHEIDFNFGQWQPLAVGTGTVEPNKVKVGTATYPSLSAAVASLQDGQDMLIGEGVYREPLVIIKNNVKITGSGRVVFDGVSAEGKAAIITKGSNIIINNLECKNISVSDENGACVRSEGSRLTVDHVYFHDSEQGILTGGNESLRVINSRFEKLGKNGQAHGIYVDAGELFIDNSLFVASVSEGHEIKSRAKKTVVTNSVVASLSSGDSRLIDIPNGGELIVSNSVLEKGPQSFNSNMIGYGLEGLTHTVNQISLTKNLIILERAGFNQLLNIPADANLPVTTADNIIISKEDLSLNGINWIYSSRDEAKIDDYPKIPTLRYDKKK